MVAKRRRLYNWEGMATMTRMPDVTNVRRVIVKSDDGLVYRELTADKYIWKKFPKGENSVRIEVAVTPAGFLIFRDKKI